MNISIESAEKDGRWTAKVHQLAGVTGEGATREEAVENAKRRAAEAVSALVKKGELPASAAGLTFLIVDKMPGA